MITPPSVVELYLNKDSRPFPCMGIHQAGLAAVYQEYWFHPSHSVQNGMDRRIG
jgi:hypothetical protein